MSRPSYPHYGRPEPKVIDDPRMEKRHPTKWYNPMYKMRAKHRARQLDIIVGNNGALELREQAERIWNHPISAELQGRFLNEVESKRRVWHSQERGDAFANGAIAAVHFEGDSRITLRLHSIPGLMNRKQARREFVGMVERISHGLTGPRRTITRLGGEYEAMLKRAHG